MRTSAIFFALCVAVAAAAPAAAPAEQAIPLGAVPVEKVDAVKDSMTKGFFADLAQVSQSIIQHAHEVAERIIKNIDKVAHSALLNLERDKPQVVAAPTTFTPVNGAPVTGAPVTGARVTGAPTTAAPVMKTADLKDGPIMGVDMIMNDAAVAAPAALAPTAEH